MLAVDTSGSVKPGELERFGAELQAILSMNPSLIHLVYADMAVTGYEKVGLGDLNLSLKPKGGGGTDFTVVFDFVEKQGHTSVLPAVFYGYGMPAFSPICA